MKKVHGATSRAIVGILLAAIALGGALALHNEVRAGTLDPPLCLDAQGFLKKCPASQKYVPGADYRPGWVDPIAITLAVAGIGCGLLLLAQSARSDPARTRPAA